MSMDLPLHEALLSMLIATEGSLQEWDHALTRDSNDAEYEAGLDMANTLEFVANKLRDLLGLGFEIVEH
jgi:hypothetical protein